MQWLSKRVLRRIRNAEEEGLYSAFEISIILKGLNALLEIVLSVILFFTARHSDFLIALVENALVDDPNDFLWRHAHTFIAYLDPRVQLFASFYLFMHGVVKSVLIFGLLRDKLWAYPAAIAVFSLFVSYQAFKWLHHHSIPLLMLTMFDLVVIGLIAHEYHRRLAVLRIPPAA